MANNVAVTPGSGATFKTTDTAGIHTPHHNVDSLPALPAGTNVIGKVTPQVAGADVATGNPVPVSDAGGSLTVDGTVGVSGTVTVGAHAVTNAGTFLTQENGPALTALQLIDNPVGTVAAAAPGSVMLAGGTDGTNARALAVTTTGLLKVDDGGGSLTVDGTVGISGPVTITDGAGSVTVDGSVGITGTPSVVNGGTFAVQESGAALAALQLLDDAMGSPGSAVPTKASLAGGTDGTNTRMLAVTTGGLLKVDDGGGSLTVDGTVAVSGAVTVNAHAVTNAGSFPVQESGGALTALQLIDNPVAVDGAAAVTGLFQVGGTDGTNAQILSTTAAGLLNIADGGGSLTVDGTVAVSGTVPVSDGGSSITVDGAVTVSDGGGSLTVDGTVVVSGTVPVSNAGTFPVQVDGAALTSLQLADDVVATLGSAVPTKGSLAAGTDGTNARAIAVTTAGLVKIDDAGGSITIDGSVGITGSLPAGSAAIGKVTPQVGGSDVSTTNRMPVQGNGCLSVLPTMGTQTSGAYAAGDFVDGKLPLLNIVPASGGSGIIHNVKVFSKSPQTTTFWVVLFNADPTGTTFADNGVGSIADADLNKIIGIAKCDAVFNLVAGSVHQASALGFPFKVAATSAWACVIAVSAITQTSTSDMILMVDVIPD